MFKYIYFLNSLVKSVYSLLGNSRLQMKKRIENHSSNSMKVNFDTPWSYISKFSKKAALAKIEAAATTTSDSALCSCLNLIESFFLDI